MQTLYLLLIFIVVVVLWWCLSYLGASLIEKYGERNKSARLLGQVLIYGSLAVLIALVAGTIIYRMIGVLKNGYEPTQDGLYCAEVEYYNPESGTKTSIETTVVLEDYQLVKINFNNGGWLDSDHFEPEDISVGHAKITSDKGYDYNVKLKHEGGCGFE